MGSTRVCTRAAQSVSRQISSPRAYSTVHDVPRTTASIPHTIPAAPSSSVFDSAVNSAGPRNTWTREEITQIYKVPLMELAYAAVGT